MQGLEGGRANLIKVLRGNVFNLFMVAVPSLKFYYVTYLRRLSIIMWVIAFPASLLIAHRVTTDKDKEKS